MFGRIDEMLRTFVPLVILIGVGAPGLAGCGSTGLAAGERCVADSECELELCLSNRCMNPSGDEDGDGLANIDEGRLRTNPLHPDTDHDGRTDGDEVGGDATAPTDSDSDSVPDVRESMVADADLDCVPDQLDADDEAPGADPGLMASIHCSLLGVCAGAAVSATCDAGVPHCAWTDAAYEPEETRCDGLDNDCDGHVDEGSSWGGLAVGSPCSGQGACSFVAGEVECALDGSAVCSTNPNGSRSLVSSEACNAVDDDCDGDTDEGLELGPDGPALGAPCDGVGICGAGVVECGLGGSLLCSTHPGGSSYLNAAELCDGLDNDCDGDTDEIFSLADGAEIGDACGSGQCAGGVVVCSADQLAALCSTDAAATPELCNGEDDDCDGEVDETEEIDPALAGCPTLGVCALDGAVAAVCSGGLWQCVAGLGSGWEPDTEVTCDGVDNDCDGLTDESFAYAPGPPDAPDTLPIGAACGLGACDGGTVKCAQDGKGAICTTAFKASLEICNGLDDDCDGQVDEGQTWEGLALGAPCQGKGACGAGLVTCNPALGKATCSSDADGIESQAAKEVCNLLDDDCDGQVDELDDVLTNTPACFAPGICGFGDAVPLACEEGQLVCDLSPVPGWEQDEELSCDGQDNDCDGTVDESLAKSPSSEWGLLAAGTPPPRAEMVAAWDPLSSTVVVVGGEAAMPSPDGPQLSTLDDTWVYQPSNGTWDERLVKGPPPRRAATLVADPTGPRLIRFGGQTPEGALSADVQVVDTTTWVWSTLEVAGSVTGRAGHCATVDAETGWMWVIGGASDGTGHAVVALDLVELEWVTSLPKGPGWRDGTAAVFEPGGESGATAGGRVVVFGGERPDGTLDDGTWILSIEDAGWTPFEPLVSPPPRRDHRMAFADGDVWLYGGVGASGDVLGDLWRFDLDSLSWSPVETATVPPARRSPAFVHAPELGLVLLGGSAGPEAMDDAWVLQGSPQADAPPSWAQLGAGSLPPARADAFMTVTDPGHLLLFGGVRHGLESVSPLGDLWMVDAAGGGPWTLISDDGPARGGAAAAWDPVGRRLFVHGGHLDGAPGANVMAETSAWVWSEGSWTELSTTSPLPAVWAHAAFYDAAGDRLLLAGGLTGAPGPGQTPTADVWVVELLTAEGAVPTVGLLQSTGTPPPPIHGHVMVADPAHGRAILATGVGAGGGVWALDLTTDTWSKIAAVPSLAVPHPAVLLEPHGQRLLLGTAATGKPTFFDVDLVSGALTKLTLAPAPTALARTSATYDAALGQATLFGGIDLQGHTRDSFWVLDYDCPD